MHAPILRYFDEVARAGSIRQAAKQLQGLRANPLLGEIEQQVTAASTEGIKTIGFVSENLAQMQVSVSLGMLVQRLPAFLIFE